MLGTQSESCQGLDSTWILGKLGPARDSTQSLTYMGRDLGGMAVIQQAALGNINPGRDDARGLASQHKQPGLTCESHEGTSKDRAPAVDVTLLCDGGLLFGRMRTLAVRFWRWALWPT